MRSNILALFLCLGVMAQSNHTSTKRAIFLTRSASNPQRTAVFGSFLFLFSTATFFPAAWVGYAVKRHLDEGKTVADASAGQAFVAIVGTVLGGATAFLWGQGLFHFADAAVSAIFNPSDSVVVSFPFEP